MSSDVLESVAWAMETSVQLLPVLPDLLVDLQELGTSAEQIVSALQSVGAAPNSRVLDLGCGKGAVAVALAERLGLRVDGVDAFPPFLRSARTLARERGVDSRCRFRQGDIRTLLGQEARYDAVLLLSVGPIAGDHEQTVAGLRTLVRRGGCIVIEDGFLADGIAEVPGADGYAGRAETRRRLTAHGDELLREDVTPAGALRALNERNTELIRRRSHQVRAAHPELSDLIDAYVARQVHETRRLGTELICASWVLRRASVARLAAQI